MYNNNQDTRWGGKRKGSGRKSKSEYKQFHKARLEDELHEWLENENGRYKSWNLFFRELRKRYVQSNTNPEVSQ